MTNRSGRLTDRLSAFFMYSVLSLIVLFFSFKLINYAFDAKFYHLFLLKWETALLSFSSSSNGYPKFTGNNHVVYMDDLIKRLMNNSISIPKSNTDTPYVYQVVTANPFQKGQKIFILCFYNRIIIYNMPEIMFKRLDYFIDGKHDMKKGVFTGIYGKNEKQYIGQFKL